MKASYDKTEDILTIEVASGTIDHAEEAGQVIVHFSPEDKPLVLEILNAADFVKNLGKTVEPTAASIS